MKLKARGFARCGAGIPGRPGRPGDRPSSRSIQYRLPYTRINVIILYNSTVRFNDRHRGPARLTDTEVSLTPVTLHTVDIL
jgi:hypothetical protein